MSSLGRVASSIGRRIVVRASASSSIISLNNSININGNIVFSNDSLGRKRFSTDIVPGIGLGKTSTGLTGIPVDPDAVQKIIDGNQALLDKMASSDMPADARYRMNVEAVARFRIAACNDHYDDPEKIEELCDCGQVEELAIQAKEEMIVLDMYLETRMWERIVNTEVEYHYEEPEDEGKEDTAEGNK